MALDVEWVMSETGVFDLKNDLTSSRGRDVCLNTVHLLSSLKFSLVVCAHSERW